MKNGDFPVRYVKLPEGNMVILVLLATTSINIAAQVVPADKAEEAPWQPMEFVNVSKD